MSRIVARYSIKYLVTASLIDDRRVDDGKKEGYLGSVASCWLEGTLFGLEQRTRVVGDGPISAFDVEELVTGSNNGEGLLLINGERGVVARGIIDEDGDEASDACATKESFGDWTDVKNCDKCSYDTKRREDNIFDTKRGNVWEEGRIDGRGVTKKLTVYGYVYVSFSLRSFNSIEYFWEMILS